MERLVLDNASMVVKKAWQAEREHLRPLPAHRPETCRQMSRVADKFGHVKVALVSGCLCATERPQCVALLWGVRAPPRQPCGGGNGAGKGAPPASASAAAACGLSPQDLSVAAKDLDSDVPETATRAVATLTSAGEAATLWLVDVVLYEYPQGMGAERALTILGRIQPALAAFLGGQIDEHGEAWPGVRATQMPAVHVYRRFQLHLSKPVPEWAAVIEDQRVAAIAGSDPRVAGKLRLLSQSKNASLRYAARKVLGDQ